jgi:hypothetical protein
MNPILDIFGNLKIQFNTENDKLNWGDLMATRHILKSRDFKQINYFCAKKVII